MNLAVLFLFRFHCGPERGILTCYELGLVRGMLIEALRPRPVEEKDVDVGFWGEYYLFCWPNAGCFKSPIVPC